MTGKTKFWRCQQPVMVAIGNKTFLKLFVFALMLSLLAPMAAMGAGIDVDLSKRNPVDLDWKLQRDIGGVKVYVAIKAIHADLSSQLSERNLWAIGGLLMGAVKMLKSELTTGCTQHRRE